MLRYSVRSAAFRKNADADATRASSATAWCSARFIPLCLPRWSISLTRLGRTLIEPLHALCRWSEKHLAELQANRARAKQAVLE